MQLIMDLSNYIEQLPAQSRAKSGVKLLERSLTEIVLLYQIADAAFAVAACRSDKTQLIDELENLVTEYFARLNDH